MKNKSKFKISNIIQKYRHNKMKNKSKFKISNVIQKYRHSKMKNKNTTHSKQFQNIIEKS